MQQGRRRRQVQGNFAVGDRVMALWPPSGTWHPASIKEFIRGKYKVQYHEDRLTRYLFEHQRMESCLLSKGKICKTSPSKVKIISLAMSLIATRKMLAEMKVQWILQESMPNPGALKENGVRQKSQQYRQLHQCCI
ncbi:uncharacterized protein LOC117121225 [Anneissia japonica]|uniref:uncharacterized protein LOC117121225 n=1 Tax=Anneissia japonica TaxID=1529436 RepID=UPI00142597B4|nr:uncharacterized protein LOC117121225 [Anneissia japonica]